MNRASLIRIALIFLIATQAIAVSAETIVIGIITKTDKSPFFRKMKEGAMLGATVHRTKLLMASGQDDSDTASQISAIQNMVAEGARTILITPTGKAVTPAIEVARAKGIQVIALDSPSEPPNGTDALFATDNYQAGVLIGKYVKASFDERFKGQAIKIVMLDLFAGNTVSAQRHNGFLSGLGLPSNGPDSTEASALPEVVCMRDVLGNKEQALKAMSDCLHSNASVNVVYTINEPAAAGAFEALKVAKREKDVLIVSIDGSCAGVQMVESGAIVATSQQFPLTMAAMGVDAAVAYSKHGIKAVGYVDTGATLISAKPMIGVPSKDVQFGLDTCFGAK